MLVGKAQGGGTVNRKNLPLPKRPLGNKKNGEGFFPKSSSEKKKHKGLGGGERKVLRTREKKGRQPKRQKSTLPEHVRSEKETKEVPGNIDRERGVACVAENPGNSTGSTQEVGQPRRKASQEEDVCQKRQSKINEKLAEKKEDDGRKLRKGLYTQETC